MQKVRTGLSASQIKWIALIFMTIDHLDGVFRNIDFLSQWTGMLRLFGRIAAPLFLYLLTESIRHTSSKRNLIFRLYIAGVATDLFTIITNLLFGSFLVTSPGNIFFTYLYTAVLIVTLERGQEFIRNRDFARAGLLFFVCGTFVILGQVCFNFFDTCNYQHSF